MKLSEEGAEDMRRLEGARVREALAKVENKLPPAEQLEEEIGRLQPAEGFGQRHVIGLDMANGVDRASYRCGDCGYEVGQLGEMIEHMRRHGARGLMVTKWP